MAYELMEHTADIMVRCHGDTLEECFTSAAEALFDQITDIVSIEPTMTFDLEATGDTEESRLYGFLSELLFIQDSESVVMCDFDVIFDGDTVRCVAHGERLDPKKHRLKGEIKAITYHMLTVDPEEPSVTVIFDV